MLSQRSNHDPLMKKKGKIGAMIIKLDLEKAYDHLEWSFIRKALLFFEFPKCFINLVLRCISSSRINILFNGERLETFSPSRGIRQGDPISPYIFILCMEYLSTLIENEVDQRNLRGIRLTRGSLQLSYLFFAEMFFCLVPQTIHLIR